jgi:hypothetical protein
MTGRCMPQVVNASGTVSASTDIAFTRRLAMMAATHATAI